MIFFLHGEDTYRSRQKVRQIKEKFKTADKSGVNLVILDGGKIQFKDFKKEITTIPFLYSKKLIVIENLLGKDNTKRQGEMISFIEQDQIPKNCIIIFWEESKVNSNTKIFKLLNRPRFAERFDLLRGIKLNNWIEAEVKKRKAKIETEALGALAEFVGSDLWQMAGEIDKLTAHSAAKKEKKNTITLDDVNLLVKEKADNNIFVLIDALSSKNKKTALKLLDGQIEGGANELYILRMLVRQFKILLQVKEMVEKDLPALKIDSAFRGRVARELKIHPFAAIKALGQIKNFTFEELKEIYNQLLEIEIKIKSTNINPRILFEVFISKNC